MHHEKKTQTEELQQLKLLPVLKQVNQTISQMNKTSNFG
jgi:hypothetical protein